MTGKRIAVALLMLSIALLAAVAVAAPGDLDPSFGDQGVVATATAPADGSDFQNGIAVERGGSVIVAGSSDMGPGGHQLRVSRYTKRGALDASFGSGGTVLTPVSSLGGFDEHIWDIALAPDGKIVAGGEAHMGAGYGGDNFAVARYSADGALDASFGSGGVVVTAAAAGDNRDNVNAVAVQADGKIVVAGGIRMGAGNSNNDFVLGRYNSDGSLDSSFGGDGIVTTAVALGTRNDGITGVAVQPDGKIVAGGQADMGPGAGRFNFAFARYNPDGSLDPSFGGDGIVTTSVAAGDGFDTAWAFALQADGKIVGAGDALVGAGFDVALARYNPDGSLDASFGGDGIVTMPLGSEDAFDVAWAVAVDPAGRVLIAGESTIEVPDWAVARLTPDGELDTTFGTGGVVVSSISPEGGYDVAFELALDKGGKIVTAGECDRPETGTDVCVARYKAGD